jgi:hypothetical protein
MVVPLTATEMALPTLNSLSECAEYSKIFGPYWPQLYALPNQVYSALGDMDALKHIYLSTNPAISGLAWCIAAFPVFFVVAEANRNYSQVDRFWSLLPTFFNLHYAVWARLNGLPTQRVDNVLAFSVLWSIRLTFNYWRRGGYQIGSEDYRWELIKKRIGAFPFFLMHIFFIASAQLVHAPVLATFGSMADIHRSFYGVPLSRLTCSSSSLAFTQRSMVTTSCSAEF